MRRPKISRRWLKPGLVVAAVLLVLGAGAAAAFESDTVGSYWRGLWWAVSLMTTVGFIGGPPKTAQGAAISVVLMLAGFALLSLVSAALASLFVRQDEEPVDRREAATEQQILEALTSIIDRLDRLEDSVREEAEPVRDERRPPP